MKNLEKYHKYITSAFCFLPLISMIISDSLNFGKHKRYLSSMIIGFLYIPLLIFGYYLNPKPLKKKDLIVLIFSLLLIIITLIWLYTKIISITLY